VQSLPPNPLPPVQVISFLLKTSSQRKMHK
jgi:hypothetical protein